MVNIIARKADGSIVIDTLIETDGFERGTDEIVAACRRAAQSVEGIGEKAKIALEKSINAFEKQNDAYRQQKQKVQELRAELEKMRGTDVETDEYKELNAEIEKTALALNKIDEKKEKAFAINPNEYSKTFDKLEYEADQLDAKLQRLIARKKALEGSGGAYTKFDTSGLEASVIKEETKLKHISGTLGTSYAAIKDATAKTRDFAESQDKAAKSTTAFEKSIKKSTKNILSYVFGIRTLFFLFNKIRAALAEGFRNLAQYSGDVNKSISTVQSSLATLKNSLATAFAPILNAVAPILQKLIDLLIQAANYVSLFFAVLQGKSTYTRAVAVQKDYAASLGGTADAAGSAAGALEDMKDAADNLSGLDEINKWQEKDKSTGSSGGGGGISSGGMSPSEMFEEVEIENAADLEKKLRNILDVVTAVGVGLAAWEIAKGLLGNLDSVDTKVAGVAAIATGITLFVNDVKAIKDGEYTNTSAESSIKALLEGASIGVGVSWLAGTPLGLSLAIATVLTFAIKDLVVNWDDHYKPAYDSLEDSIISFFEGDINGAVNSFQDRLGYIFSADSWNVTITDSLLGKGTIDKVLDAFENDEDFLYKNLPEMFAFPFNTNYDITKEWPDLWAETKDAWKTFDFDEFKDSWEDAEDTVTDAGKGMAKSSKTNSKGVSSAWNGAGKSTNKSFTSMGSASSKEFKNIDTNVTKNTNNATNTAKTSWNGAKGSLSSIWGTLRSTSSTEFGGIRSNANNSFSKTKTESTNTWGGLSTSLSNTWSNMKNNAVNSFSTVKTKVTEVFTKLKNSLKTPINGIISFLNRMISGTTSAINKVINALNGLSFKVPNWVPTYGGHKFGFNLSTIKSYTIPYLASGAVIPPNREFMAVLGDQKHGTNIETPEALLRKIIREELGGGSGGSYQFTAQINRRTLFDEVIAEAKLRRSANGKNPFQLA